MVTETLRTKIEEIRGKLAQEHTNPKSLQDEVLEAVNLLNSAHEAVPADLREAIEELQSEIIEEFYDNLPV